MKNRGMGKAGAALRRLLSASLISTSIPQHLEPTARAAA